MCNGLPLLVIERRSWRELRGSDPTAPKLCMMAIPMWFQSIPTDEAGNPSAAKSSMTKSGVEVHSTCCVSPPRWPSCSNTLPGPTSHDRRQTSMWPAPDRVTANCIGDRQNGWYRSVPGRFVALLATVEPVQETLGCDKPVSLLDCVRDLVPVNTLAFGGVEEHAEPIA